MAKEGAGSTRGIIGGLRRELADCFAAPVGWGFVAGFAALASALAFFAGDLLGRGEADLQPFFAFHPWIYATLLPAVVVTLRHEEGGNSAAAAVYRFLAQWCLVAAALALTVPLWLTVSLFGRADQGAIAAGYFGSWLLAGTVLAMGSAVAAAIRHPALAYAVTTILVIALAAPVSSAVLDLLPAPMPVDLTGIAPVAHFAAIEQGAIGLRDLIYFASLIAVFLGAVPILVDLRRAG